MDGDGYSIVTGQVRTFHTADYVVLAATLTVSAGIGFFYAVKDRNNVSTSEFLLGGRKMHVIPIAMSLLVTFHSALTILGTPAEVYTYNSMFWWICVGFVLATVGAVRVFIPFFYRLGTTSVFEYLEMRFGRSVRFIVSLLFVIQIMLYMSFVLYAPCLANSAAMGAARIFTLIMGKVPRVRGDAFSLPSETSLQLLDSTETAVVEVIPDVIMLMCVLYTNLKDSDVPPQLEARLAELIGKVLDRPMEQLNVLVLSGQRQFRLHNTDPACFLPITCIAAFDKDRNPTYTPPILDFLKTNLKLRAERILIQYLPAEKHQFNA